MKTTVLLIEDEDPFALLVEKQLGADYQVRREKTLTEGLKAVEKDAGEIDIVLLDLGLPDTETVEGTLRQFFDRHIEIAALIISNYSDPDLMMRALSLGAQGYLIKTKINSDWLRSAVLQAVLIRRNQRHYKQQMTSVFRELYRVWEEESVRLYQMADAFSAQDKSETIYKAAEEISDRLAKLAHFIAPEIRDL